MSAEAHQQRAAITARRGRRVTPVFTVVTVENSVCPCPSCGHHDVSAWADDGESDSADWWECGRCGCSGAFLHMDPGKNTTPNGLPIAPLAEKAALR